MSVAESFTALGVGNGTPMCFTGQIGEFSPVFVADLTLEELMAFFWNIESIRFQFSLNVQYEQRLNPGSSNEDAEYEINNRNVIRDYISYGNFDPSTLVETPAPKPKDRICPSPFEFSQVQGDSFFSINSIGSYTMRQSDGLFSILSNPSFWNSFMGLSASYMIAGSNVRAPNSQNATITLEEEATGTFWGKPIPVQIWSVVRAKPYLGTSYISHTFNYLTVTPEFYEYGT